METIGLDEETTRKNLACLSGQKVKILQVKRVGVTPGSTPEGSQADAEMIETAGVKSLDDRVTLNKGFSSNLLRLNLPIPTLE